MEKNCIYKQEFKRIKHLGIINFKSCRIYKKKTFKALLRDMNEHSKEWKDNPVIERRVEYYKDVTSPQVNL